MKEAAKLIALIAIFVLALFGAWLTYDMIEHKAEAATVEPIFDAGLTDPSPPPVIEEPVEEEIVEEEPVEEVEETEEVVEEEYYEEEPYEEVELYSASYDGSAEDFRRDGVIYYGDFSYTWYSQRVLPGGGLTALNNNGRHVDERGFVCDGDGYIAVASDDFPEGTVVDTPFGAGKVYDCGSGYDNIDIYVDF